MPVLVTGAGGWVGSHVVYQLVESGCDVRGTVRSLESGAYNFLNEIHPHAKERVELVEADLLLPSGWDKAVEGCEYVIHCASPFNFSLKNDDIVKTAVEGVRHVFQAALKCPTVKRIVHTSSVVSICYGHPNKRYQCNRSDLDRMSANMCSLDQKSHEITAHKKTDENTPVQSVSHENSTGTTYGDFSLFDEAEYTVAENVSGYVKSKIMAEMLAWEMVKEHNANHADHQVELVVICPAFVFGPIMDKRHAIGESSNQILRLMKREYPMVPKLTSSHVDVRDVALVHVMATQLPSTQVANKRFIAAATDGNVTFLDEAQMLAEEFGKYGFRIPTMVAPDTLLFIGKYFSSAMREAASKRQAVAYVCNDQASKVFRINWRSTRSALRDHAMSLIKFGVLDKRNTPDEVVNKFTAY